MKVTDHQNTKIVATVGPACSSLDGLRSLIEAGVDVFRLNFSHGSHEVHGGVIERIVQLNKELNTHVSILADLQGPKLRVGKMEGDGLPVEEGQVITFTNTECIGNAERIYMSYPQFAQDVSVGERVLVDDGTLVFEVIETNGVDTVKLKTLFGGVLKSNKGVNLPNTKISLPSLTEKDLNDLEYILTQPVNWIALSFVRHHKDCKDLRARIEAAGHPAKIISKIEKPEAVQNIDKIIKHSNAIMVARGDLGIEIPMEQLPIVQKEIIRKCIQRARPVIVATQMMDSMITNPGPTRAEVTDVANAVLDGTDAVMLSGETSVGRHPALVVKAMNAIIHEAEKIYEIGMKRPKANPKSGTFIGDVVCSAAAWAAQNVGARGIIGMTQSGYTAFKLSSFRPKAKIYIFSDLHHMLATLNLCWGVRCYHYDNYTSTDKTVEDVTEILKQAGRVEPGDLLVNTGSMPLEKRLRTNMMKVTVVD
ncbi:pyruvate kinase [Lewinella sp. W8]|uniref:pyruvate kinase n=1 Tax=Lewinella sp. W8 TaxID=2528208 RepID=UPI0010682F14|nr:pyruvate kinase [Lewinella sp. W8]MTB49582.1 pyruvate kinase [Lewinella sp. W8]